jgi:hypothetical protein
MQVTTIKYGRTVKREPGGFEFERLDVEIIPQREQSVEEAFSELRQYVDDALESIISNGKAGLAPSVDRPKTPIEHPATKRIREKAKTKAAQTKPKPQAAPEAINRALGSPAKKSEPVEEPPFDEEPGTLPMSVKLNKEGLLDQTLGSENVKQLCDNFNLLREHAMDFGDDWDSILTRVHACYKSVNTQDTDKLVRETFSKAFKAERQFAFDRKTAKEQ